MESVAVRCLFAASMLVLLSVPFTAQAFSLPFPWNPRTSGTENSQIKLADPSGGQLPCNLGTSLEGVAITAYLGPSGEIFTTNYLDDTLSVLTPGQTTVTIQVGPNPLDVAIDLKTNTVFVTNNGGDTVTVIQLTSANTYAVTTASVGFRPFGIAVDPSTDDVYVANSGSGTVSVLNGFTYNNITPQSPIEVGGCPTGVGIDPATDTAYVANAATGAVTLINTKTLTASNTTIPVGSDPTSVAVFVNPVSSLPSYVYVTNSGSNTVSVINAATNTVVATIIVP